MADPPSPRILEHFENPRNVGSLEAANAVARVSNPVCGDVLELDLRIEPEREVIEAARFRVKGCSTSIACASLLTELLEGRTLAEARAIGAEDIARALGGLARTRVHASILAADGLQAALADFASRRRREGSR